MPSIVSSIVHIETKYLYEGIFGENVDYRCHLAHILPFSNRCEMMQKKTYINLFD